MRLTTIIISLSVLLNGCFLFPDDNSPKGNSTMTAEVNGEKIIFSDVKGGDYFGMHLYGESKYRISIDLLTELGSYKWKSMGEFKDLPKVEFIYYSTIDSIGELTITNYIKDKMLIEGTFNCKAYHRQNLDTIVVTNGKFSLYYTLGK